MQSLLANVRLPKVFGPHMVLQRRKPVPVWGWADAGEKITVTLANQTKKTKAGKDGTWRVTLDPMEAGGPFQLTVKGKKDAITLNDVLAGEVWICSGQSNMEWPLRAAANGPKEVNRANYPQIRQLAVKKAVSLTPKDDIEGEWTVCSPATAADFTAVGYFFARQLQQELNVPIGLINNAWGGTHSETWTSREAMLTDPELAKSITRLPADIEELNRKAALEARQLIEKIQDGKLPTAAETSTWAKPAFDAEKWQRMTVPGNWETRGLPALDGVVWFRREITLADSVSLKNALLQLGTIDDADSAYVNGQLVGTTNAYDQPRRYALPTGLLKAGVNVIVIRINDTGGGGGFTGAPADMKLSTDGVDLPLGGVWQYRVAQLLASWEKSDPNAHGTLLFNAMLNPLIPYAVAGVIWYQGESNAGRAFQYRRTFPLMIQDWRQHWKEDFPFLFVQLANFNAGNGNSRRGSAWAELREAQTMTLKLPRTGMAVTSDIGDATNIHPTNKQDVGRRLAAEAMRVVYQKSDVSAGPLFETMTIAGSQAVLTFRNADGGLAVKDKYGYTKGFEIAGADQVFYYAKAEIQGNSVVVRADSVAAPVAVRYGWADDNGEVNLYNSAGFPAVPFRTDAWKSSTEAVKFEE